MQEDMSMKCMAIFAEIGLLGVGCGFAESRVFTNAEGLTLAAEVFSVIEDNVELKLPNTNTNTATVPLKLLSADDQAYLAVVYTIYKLASTSVEPC